MKEDDDLDVEKKTIRKNYIKRNSMISVYDLSLNLQIFPIAGFYAALQIKCFCK